MNEDDSEDPHGAEDARQMLAGEYVLGTLSSGERLDVERRMLQEPELKAAVENWERRLSPLAEVAPPIEPSSELWGRIAHRIDPSTVDRPVHVPLWRRWWESLALWRGLSAAAVAAALVLGLRPALVGEGLHPRYVVVLVAPGGVSPGWVVQVRAPGDARLAAIAQAPVPSDRALELWTKADDWQAPISLGLVQPGEPVQLRLDALPVLQANQLFEITLEPPTGSPTGRPTGPIQYIGRAVELRS
ncbi:MAG: anti-sigma factor [Lautropia sp.]